MAKFRYVILEQDLAKASGLDGGTETIDLPLTGILTELTIQVRSTGALSDDMVTPMWVILNKIEVLVNGSQVVKSLSGEKIRALEWYNKGPFAMSYDYWSEDSSNARYNSFTLYFNRFHGDTAYGLNCASYKNPQLKITWDTTATSYDGMTFDAHTDPTMTFSIIAKMLEGTPVGWQNKYVKTSVIDTWTTAASTTHKTEIPLGFPLRGLMYRGAYTGINMEYTLESIKLDFDNGMWVPIDLNYAQFWNVFKSWYPEPVVVGGTIRVKDSVEWDPQVYKIVSMSFAPQGATNIVIGKTSSRHNLGTIMALTATTAAASAMGTMYCGVMGWGPMQSLYIPMGKLTDGVAETIDTNGYERIVLSCTAGASSGSSGSQYLVAEYDIPNGR